MTQKNKKEGLSAGDYGIVIGGNVNNSNIVMGDGNTVSLSATSLDSFFKDMEQMVDEQPNLKPDDKEDIKAELQEIHVALKAKEPDETFLARRFRNLKRMAPDILEVAIETLKNPIGGVAEVIKRVAKKMAEDAAAS